MRFAATDILPSSSHVLTVDSQVRHIAPVITPLDEPHPDISQGIIHKRTTSANGDFLVVELEDEGLRAFHVFDISEARDDQWLSVFKDQLSAEQYASEKAEGKDQCLLTAEGKLLD